LLRPWRAVRIDRGRGLSRRGAHGRAASTPLGPAADQRSYCPEGVAAAPAPRTGREHRLIPSLRRSATAAGPWQAARRRPAGYRAAGGAVTERRRRRAATELARAERAYRKAQGAVLAREEGAPERMARAMARYRRADEAARRASGDVD